LVNDVLVNVIISYDDVNALNAGVVVVIRHVNVAIDSKPSSSLVIINDDAINASNAIDVINAIIRLISPIDVIDPITKRTISFK